MLVRHTFPGLSLSQRARKGVKRQRDKEKSLRNVAAKSGKVETRPRQGSAAESRERRFFLNNWNWM